MRNDTEPRLLPDKTNEELLALLEQARQSRRQTRKALKGAFGSCIVVYSSLLIWWEWQLFTHRNFVSPNFISLIFALYAVFMAALYSANLLFYRKASRQRDLVIAALSQREETRALGPLLEIMDMRASGAMAWGKSRPVLIRSMAHLLDRLTPDDFQNLSDAQIHQLTPMLLLHDPTLCPSVEKALCRCGDARALRALRRLQRWSKTNVAMQKWYPGMKFMMKRMRKRHMPVLDAESAESVARCCTDIAGRVEADLRNSQLLRASGSEGVNAASELLRGANADTNFVASDHLLRPAPSSGEPETAVVSAVAPRFVPVLETETADTQQITASNR